MSFSLPGEHGDGRVVCVFPQWTGGRISQFFSRLLYRWRWRKNGTLYRGVQSAGGLIANMLIHGESVDSIKKGFKVESLGSKCDEKVRQEIEQNINKLVDELAEHMQTCPECRQAMLNTKLEIGIELTPEEQAEVEQEEQNAAKEAAKKFGPR